MRSGSARKSGKAKVGGGNSHPHIHTRFRLSVSILGEGGAFAVPTSAAPAVMRALRPLNVTPAAPVRGRLPSAVLGVNPTPRSTAPPTPAPSSAPVAAAPRIVHSLSLPLSQMEWGAQDTGTPPASRPKAGGARLGFPPTAARARPEVGVGWGSAAEDAVDITAESTRLSGRCGDPSAFAPPLHPSLPAPSSVWAGRRRG